jgi:7-cyano-7-deazaguanine synthase
VVDTGTKPETGIIVETPIIAMKKSEIVKKGAELQAPIRLSWSCYQYGEVACGICDSCALRLRGFQQAGIEDPIPYRQKPRYS